MQLGMGADLRQQRRLLLHPLPAKRGRKGAVNIMMNDAISMCSINIPICTFQSPHLQLALNFVGKKLSKTDLTALETVYDVFTLLVK